jgi:hypothetical protein
MEEQKLPKIEQMVIVELDDDIVSLSAKLTKINKNHDQVFLFAPNETGVVSNINNLALLAKLSGKNGQKLTIITNDNATWDFAKSLKIPVRRLAGTKLKKDFVTHNWDIHGEIPRFSDEDPTRRENVKISIADIVKSRHQDEEDLDLPPLLRLRAWLKNLKNGPRHKQQRFIQNPQNHALIGLIGSALILLGVIAYIALPSATITIEPAKIVSEESFNVRLLDRSINREILAKNEPLTISANFLLLDNLQKTITHKTTGRLFSGDNARGEIIVYNEDNKPYEFVPRTQFHTEDGLIFRATNYVKLQPGSVEDPAQTTIEVVADAFDVAGLPIGGRGNIGPSRFKVAKLPAETQKFVYGESKKPMAGGTDESQIQVIAADIEQATNTAIKALRNQIPELVAQRLLNDPILKQANLQVFEQDDILKFQEPQVQVDKSILGTNLESFPLNVQTSAEAIAYKQEDLNKLIETELKKRQGPDKKLLQIDPTGFTYQVINRDFEKGILELTVNIKALLVYNLKSSQFGLSFSQEVKDRVAGLRVNEAEAALKDLPEVEQAIVKSWPFWAPTLPKATNSLKLVIN